MEINTKAVNDLIEEKYRGNKTWFAEELDVDRSYLSMILNGKKKKKDSKKIIDHLIIYCQKNHLDYKNYIFLP